MGCYSDIGKINRQTSWSKVLEFSLEAIPGCEVLAVEKIALLLTGYQLRPNRLSKLKEAVRGAASSMIEDASLLAHERLINFQVLVSGAVLALHPQTQQVKAEKAKVAWGFFLVQILDGGLETGESNYLLRLYMYVEGDQLEQ